MRPGIPIHSKRLSNLVAIAASLPKYISAALLQGNFGLNWIAKDGTWCKQPRPPGFEVWLVGPRRCPTDFAGVFSKPVLKHAILPKWPTWKVEKLRNSPKGPDSFTHLQIATRKPPVSRSSPQYPCGDHGFAQRWIRLVSARILNYPLGNVYKKLLNMAQSK